MNKLLFGLLLFCLCAGVFFLALFFLTDRLFSKPTVEVQSTAGGLLDSHPPSVYFSKIINISNKGIGTAASLEWIEANWSDQLLPYFIELRRFAGNKRSIFKPLPQN